jgi:Relaxase/Mobilisation nuclease domain/Large polyvalent protein-associated domain 7
MIAKHVPMKSIKKSDFAGLVKYLLNEQNKTERVGQVQTTNCHSDQADAATLEILNTQAQNTRAESDKTYHLIVSFRAGEHPTDATLNAIEAHICEGLGYGEHQRISVVHHDTDNLHIHIAINKIHPTRYTIHNPYNDHKTLSHLCEKLEQQYGLEVDNHHAQKTGSENRADDMERHSGVESLLSWIKRECADQMQSAQTWAALHSVMQTYGLELRAQGNGLVISDANGLTVKASSVERSLSKSKLEAKLGEFQAAAQKTAQKTNPTKHYQKQPIRIRIDTTQLYAQYQSEQQTKAATKTTESIQSRNNKARLIEAAKRAARLKRATIKLMNGPGVNKKLLYAIVSQSLQADLEKIHRQYHQEKQATQAQCQRQAWADWLRTKATEGSTDALQALRAREAAQGLKGNTISAKSAHKADAPKTTTRIDLPQDSITKKGTIIYQSGSSAIRDDGNKLTISREVTQDGLQVALQMAIAQYGNCITVNGTDDFKQQIAQAAASAKLPMTFADAELERQRLSCLNAAMGKGRTSNANAQHHATSDSNRFKGGGRGV